MGSYLKILKQFMPKMNMKDILTAESEIRRDRKISLYSNVFGETGIGSSGVRKAVPWKGMKMREGQTLGEYKSSLVESGVDEKAASGVVEGLSKIIGLTETVKKRTDRFGIVDVLIGNKRYTMPRIAYLRMEERYGKEAVSDMLQPVVYMGKETIKRQLRETAKEITPVAYSHRKT